MHSILSNAHFALQSDLPLLLFHAEIEAEAKVEAEDRLFEFSLHLINSIEM